MKLLKPSLVFVGLFFAFVQCALAQNDDYKKWEFYGGYSALQFDNIGGDTGNANVDSVLSGRNTLRGFNMSITRNFHPYVGMTFDYSLHLREDNFDNIPGATGNVDTTVQNFLGGLTFKDNATTGRWKPFAHILFGVAHQKEDLDSPQLATSFGITDFHANETSFAMAFGGGLDIRLNKRIDIRAVQIDWNVISRGDQQLGTVLIASPHQTVGQPFVVRGSRQDNLRIGAGIVIH